jgi:hypothetical protein
MGRHTRFFLLPVVLIIFLLPLSLSPQKTSSAVQAQTTVFDFIDKASQASWRSGAGALTFPGQEDDERGFALFRQGALLEDGSTASLVLETHPQWVTNGFIAGVYPARAIAAGSDLYVKVGFLSGAAGSDGVTFQVKVGQPGMQAATILNLPASLDGKLNEAVVSLAAYAGKTVTFELKVLAGQSSGQDWAVWVDARIRQSAIDSDQDGVIDGQDNCPNTPNPNQGDQDGDGQGDVCDSCDDRDPDDDGIPNCRDQCPAEPEQFNDYLDEDGCPDAPAPTEQPIGPIGEAADWFTGIREGPMEPSAFEDSDGDGVINYQDDCPSTPSALAPYVLGNGCLCTDSDNGAGRTSALTAGQAAASMPDGNYLCADTCTDDHTLRECACNPGIEDGTIAVTLGDPILNTTIDCNSLGSLPTGFSWACTLSRCIPSAPAIPRYCFSSDGTCADGIQNQGETGVDCGGICPPCNTTCTTGTRYAPPDTPCTSVYPDDPYRIELYWTDSWLEFACQYFEVCHPDLDYIVEEATACCSIPNTYEGYTREESLAAEQSAIDAMPDPNLCRAARDMTGMSAGCSRCVGLYIIKGFGEYARWLQGYTSLYPEHNTGGMGDMPAETLINDFHTGICRDYAQAVTTLLRKAGYPQTSVSKFCDGGHCYNLVKLPGDAEWHVVDTTGNLPGIVMGGLPSGHPYCAMLDMENWCYDGYRADGSVCTGTEPNTRPHAWYCSPGVACDRDFFSTPAWAPLIDQIFSCR